MARTPRFRANLAAIASPAAFREESERNRMMRPCARTRFALRAAICALMFISIGLIAIPAGAQQPQPPASIAAGQHAPLIDPDASAVQEKKLLQEFPRIQGDILIPDQRESVLVQPAGRVWRCAGRV